MHGSLIIDGHTGGSEDLVLVAGVAADYGRCRDVLRIQRTPVARSHVCGGEGERLEACMGTREITSPVAQSVGSRS